jgi:hypothetical protein
MYYAKVFLPHEEPPIRQMRKFKNSLFSVKRDFFFKGTSFKRNLTISEK